MMERAVAPWGVCCFNEAPVWIDHNAERSRCDSRPAGNDAWAYMYVSVYPRIKMHTAGLAAATAQPEPQPAPAPAPAPQPADEEGVLPADATVVTRGGVDARMSGWVKYSGLVYLSGQVGAPGPEGDGVKTAASVTDRKHVSTCIATACSSESSTEQRPSRQSTRPQSCYPMDSIVCS